MKINNVLSKKDTTAIKGVGILLIICHNFLHWIKPMLGENEFSFNPVYAQNFIDSINSSPINILQYVIAFSGHYGIHLFIFISGYGLAISYANFDVSYKDFIKKRIAKLYPVFTIALLALFVYNYLIFRMEFNSDVAIDFLIRYSLVANLIPKEVFVLNGPFWFYSMIVQLYLLFPFLMILQKRNTYFLYIIGLVSFILIFCFNQQLTELNFSLYYNFIGHFPVFILGILYAVKGAIFNKYLKWFALLGVAIILLSLYNVYFWYLSHLSFIVLFLFVYLAFKKCHFPKLLTRFILFTGSLSYYLFAVHGFLRKPWVGFANKLESNVMNYVFLALFLIVAYIAALVVKKLEQLYFSYKNNK
ncbi:acyltransferase [Lacinutrix sp. Bg11-31]|uniref:acyltransferase family protein n=1 Tax=Lacinutrix sp. Bg11-31 TaxID=2057808 RepID=UPI000C30E0B3|nr:acyltransferase [Lacinutrix sp. Bg11-31]AUC81683.1 hypothetical protein CW733_05880 [Lacinutrix sp. Bg11-31]